jgi:4-diphosphocytidyl-2-C-methyl-D-erythritol kinase
MTIGETRTIQAPAKLNLTLAVTGRRADGFHDLVSLVAPIDCCDTLSVQTIEGSEDRLATNDPTLPTDRRNLVLRAVEALRKRRPDLPRFAIDLQKRIPSGGGLGGGSSDAAAVLRLLGPETGLPSAGLAEVAAELGSDVPLFLQRGPVLLRGRGERVDEVSGPLIDFLRTHSAILLLPGIPVSTPDAFRRLQARHDFSAEDEAMAELEEIFAQPTHLLSKRRNTFRETVFQKYPALPNLLAIGEDTTSSRWSMTGSGSTLFTLVSTPEAETAQRLLAEALTAMSLPVKPLGARFFL